MRDLHAYLAAEQPTCNAFLQEKTAGLDPVVQPVVEHVLEAGGKRLRPLLTLLTARGCGNLDRNPYPMACSMELFHSATLLHDDILDGAELRRGRPSAHLVFGTTRTILAGDVLLALGNRLVAEYGNADLTLSVSDAIMSTATGEILEISHVRNPDLSVEQYLDIVTGKTAYLIQASCRCGAILAGAGEELVEAAARYGLGLGIAFQLVDDALDYAASKEVAGKPVGADLREGKLTLPLLLYLSDRTPEERAAFASHLAAEDMDDAYIEKLAAEVRDLGYAARTREMAAGYVADAEGALAIFPETREKDVLRQALAFVLSRES